MAATLARRGGSAAILPAIALSSPLLRASPALLLALLAAVPACRNAEERRAELPPLAAPSAALPSSTEPPPAQSVSSETRAVERRVQATRLELEPERWREPRLAFGKGMLGQLTAGELRVLDAGTGALLATHLLEGARLVVALADGSLLALGAERLLRVDAFTREVSTLGRPVLFPGAELHPDAILPDRIWIFDASHQGTAGGSLGTLSSLLLEPGKSGLLLPDRSIELGLSPKGILGRTREGVWLHVSGRTAERFGPGGARLPKLSLPESKGLLWLLPARRLDQCLLFERGGRLSRAVVTPAFRQLAGAQLAGMPLTAAVGDQGRLVAVVVVTGEGPRFELQLFDAELKELGRVPLVGDAPTGGPDWVKVVTQNQGVAVASSDGRVAVGGPGRVAVFDAGGKSVFSIPSQ
jgi:hypothetical protein